MKPAYDSQQGDPTLEGRIKRLEERVGRLADTFAKADANVQAEIKDLLEVIAALHPEFAALVKEKKSE